MGRPRSTKTPGRKARVKKGRTQIKQEKDSMTQTEQEKARQAELTEKEKTGSLTTAEKAELAKFTEDAA